MLYNKTKILTFIICSNLLLASASFSQENIETSDSASDKILQNTISNNPNSKTAKILCAKVYLKNNQFKQAEELIMQVLEEDHENIKANALLKELNNKYNKHIEKTVSTEERNNLIYNTEKQENIIAKTEEIKSLVNKTEEQNNGFSKTEEKKESKIINDVLLKRIPQNKPIIKMPTKEEILKKAKEKKIQEKKPDNFDLPSNNAKSEIIQNNSDNLPKEISITIPNKETKETNKENNFKETLPITVAEPLNNQNLIITNDSISDSLSDSTNEKEYKFKPFIANEIKKLKSKNNILNTNIQSSDNNSFNNTLFNDNSLLDDTSKGKFLEDNSDSFQVNLGEAYSKIEQNKPSEAMIYLDVAYALAIAGKSNKNLLDVQLTKAIVYLYECDLDNYAKHIVSIRNGISKDVYDSLQKVYDKAINIPDENGKLTYISNLAYDSGHYYTALELAKKVYPQNIESINIISKAKSAIDQINGEYLLSKGSYYSAIDYYEKENDEAEKGRTYLAISKSLLENKDILHSKITEKYGLSSLMNCITNDPNQPKANLYLALYYLDKGDKNQAKEAIRRGLNAQGTNEIITSKLLNLSENL